MYLVCSVVQHTVYNGTYNELQIGVFIVYLVKVELDESMVQDEVNSVPKPRGKNKDRVKVQGERLHWKDAQFMSWRGAGTQIWELVPPTETMMQSDTYQCWAYLTPRTDELEVNIYHPVLFDREYVAAYIYQNVVRHCGVELLATLKKDVEAYIEEYAVLEVNYALEETAQRMAVQLNVSVEEALDMLKAVKERKDNASATPATNGKAGTKTRAKAKA